MKLIVPDYYTDFEYIADRCRHSCCIGWEIDIDEETREFYRTVGGELGQELARNIEDSDPPHFRLGENERCPFLDDRNLCRIITVLGKEALCDICADHPRFRSFFESRTEMGLGLCCEAAAELILLREAPAALVTAEDDGAENIPDNEARFLSMRDDIFAMVQDRSRSMDERITLLLTSYGIRLPARSPAEWVRIYRSLERLDAQWDSHLDKLASQSEPGSALPDIQREQLLVYFIFRHLSESLHDGMLRQRIAFAVLSTAIIDSLCAATGEPAAEIARMYSSEIEYSDENIGVLLDVLTGGGRYTYR